MPKALIIDAVRSPIGGFTKSLSTVRPDDLLAHSIEALLKRNPVDPKSVDEVFMDAPTKLERTTGMWHEWPCFSQACPSPFPASL